MVEQIVEVLSIPDIEINNGLYYQQQRKQLDGFYIKHMVRLENKVVVVYEKPSPQDSGDAGCGGGDAI